MASSSVADDVVRALNNAKLAGEPSGKVSACGSAAMTIAAAARAAAAAAAAVIAAADTT